MTLDRLSDALSRWESWECAHGRPHDTSIVRVQSHGVYLVAVIVDSECVANGEATTLPGAVRSCATEFDAYTKLLDGLQRTDDALHARAAANRNAEATR